MGQLSNNEIPTNRAALNQRAPAINRNNRAMPSGNVAHEMRGIVSRPLVVPARPRSAYPKIAALIVVLLVAGSVTFSIINQGNSTSSDGPVNSIRPKLHEEIPSTASTRVFQTNSPYRNNTGNINAVRYNESNIMKLNQTPVSPEDSKNLEINPDYEKQLAAEDLAEASSNNHPTDTGKSVTTQRISRILSRRNRGVTTPVSSFGNPETSSLSEPARTIPKASPHYGSEQAKSSISNQTPVVTSIPRTQPKRADDKVPLLPPPTALKNRIRR